LIPRRRQFTRQLAQGKWARANAPAQLIGIAPDRNLLFMAVDLAG
jgi:hypothetical protein